MGNSPSVTPLVPKMNNTHTHTRKQHRHVATPALAPTLLLPYRMCSARPTRQFMANTTRCPPQHTTPARAFLYKRFCAGRPRLCMRIGYTSGNAMEPAKPPGSFLLPRRKILVIALCGRPGIISDVQIVARKDTGGRAPFNTQFHHENVYVFEGNDSSVIVQLRPVCDDQDLLGPSLPEHPVACLKMPILGFDFAQVWHCVLPVLATRDGACEKVSTHV
jgi:hypothetical protein